MAPDPPGNDLAEIAYHVVEELKTLNRRCEDAQKHLQQLDRDLAVLKTKVWVLGLAAGTLASILSKLFFDHWGRAPQ
jgi:uncharacterized membrane protein YjjP (DUF1212 family)